MRDFERTLCESWPPADWRDVTVLVAVSGGADSVALACAMAAVRGAALGRLCVAHFNHRLRGEADDDERFVRELALRLELPCEVGGGPVATRAAEAGDGIESAARDARYRFFHEAAHRLGARHVATAHTADDQAETVLHRVLRGTGLSGLAGIRRVRPLADGVTVVRPLLALRRSEVLRYLDELRQSYRDDATNADTRFTRNRLRHELLPRLANDFNPQVVDALVRLGRLAGEAQQVVASSLVEPLLARCLRPAAGRGPGSHGTTASASGGGCVRQAHDRSAPRCFLLRCDDRLPPASSPASLRRSRILHGDLARARLCRASDGFRPLGAARPNGDRRSVRRSSNDDVSRRRRRAARPRRIDFGASGRGPRSPASGRG